MQKTTAMIFGYILGDGWITHNMRCGVAGDAESLPTIAKDIERIFNDQTLKTVYTRQTESPKYNIIGTTSHFCISAITARQLVQLGMPIGKRAEQEHLLPDWIINGSREIKAGFLSGYYAAEGLIPSMQKNDKTPKALSFSITKRAEFSENLDLLASQFVKIINDLGISVSVYTTTTFTKSENRKKEFVMSNAENQFKEELSLLDLKYCEPKEESAKSILEYLKTKDLARERLQTRAELVLKDVDAGTLSKVAIQKKFGITKKQLSRITNGEIQFKLVKDIEPYSVFCSKLFI